MAVTRRYQYIIEESSALLLFDFVELPSDHPEPEWVAEDAARDLNKRRGDDLSWPVTIELFLDKQSLGKFIVNRELVPRFSAVRKKP